MAEPRKIFRIEESAAARLAPQIEETQAALRHAEIMQELANLRTVLAAAPAAALPGNGLPHAEVERLIDELNLIRSALSGVGRRRSDRNGTDVTGTPMTRIAQELAAVMQASEQATQKILAAAEEIDQAAGNLSAALKGEIEQGLAQDILDRVIQIFEACNFQDLTSQRLAKVMATLAHIEDQIARALNELKRADEASLHGPHLDGDRGHVSQSDIDAMFEGSARSA
jgi:chemotaxis protein CheZ